MEGIQHEAKLAKVEWLAEKRIGAELVSAVDILHALGGRKHDHQHPAKAGLAANPFQNFKSIFARHFEVEEQESWERILRPVGKFAGAAEVSNDFVAMADQLQRALIADVLEGATEHEDVILTVVGEKNYWLVAFGHAWSMGSRERSSQDKKEEIAFLTMRECGGGARGNTLAR
jgi:hypothetical protein